MAETPLERRQRQEAERIMRRAMPQIEKVIKELAGQQRYATQIGDVFSKRHQELIKNIVPKLDALLPRVELPIPEFDLLAPKVLDLLPKFEFPALKLDYVELFPDTAAISEKAVEALKPSLDLIHELQRDQFADLIAVARKAALSALPPNWRGDAILIPRDLEQLLLDEGLPLAWVPPTAVLVRVFAAGTPQDRRRVIGRAWKRIAEACVAELDNVDDKRLRSHVKFGRKAAHTLLDGSSEGSQALSANLLDSILRAEFSDGDRKTITGQKTRLNIEDYPLRVAIVLGAIWGAHGQYWPEKGDKVPRAFSRHGSAHGVSSRQYSRINAVLALMHVVALLRLLDSDLREA